ncbi:hypothetical protein [Helicobacter sp. T3_23-1056]
MRGNPHTPSLRALQGQRAAIYGVCSGFGFFVGFFWRGFAWIPPSLAEGARGWVFLDSQPSLWVMIPPPSLQTMILLLSLRASETSVAIYGVCSGIGFFCGFVFVAGFWRGFTLPCGGGLGVGKIVIASKS